VLACALMFLGRRGIKPADRWWFFQLAAHAAQAYVDLADAAKPNGPTVHVGPPQDEPQHEASYIPEPPSTPDEQNGPRDDTRAGRAGLRLVDDQAAEAVDARAAESRTNENVQRVDFGQRRRLKEAARLIGLIGADAARLVDEVTAIPRELPPDVAYSRATSARQLAAALAGAIGKLTDLPGPRHQVRPQHETRSIPIPPILVQMLRSHLKRYGRASPPSPASLPARPAALRPAARGRVAGTEGRRACHRSRPPRRTQRRLAAFSPAAHAWGPPASRP
jgi:hypothetical protein